MLKRFSVLFHNSIRRKRNKEQFVRGLDEALDFVNIVVQHYGFSRPVDLPAVAPKAEWPLSLSSYFHIPLDRDSNDIAIIVANSSRLAIEISYLGDYVVVHLNFYREKLRLAQLEVGFIGSSGYCGRVSWALP